MSMSVSSLDHFCLFVFCSSNSAKRLFLLVKYELIGPFC